MGCFSQELLGVVVPTDAWTFGTTGLDLLTRVDLAVKVEFLISLTFELSSPFVQVVLRAFWGFLDVSDRDSSHRCSGFLL